MISRRQGSSRPSASTCGLTQRRRTRRISNNGCFAPLVARLAAKHKPQTFPRRRIPLSNIITNKATPAQTPEPTLASEQPTPSPTCTPPPTGRACDEYTRQKLALFKDSMYAGLRNVRYANAPQRSNVLPRELQIIMDDHVDAIPPTHMLAVYAAQTTLTATKRSVTLYPAHDIVLSAHCANLPRLPDSTSESIIPVIPLALPSPQMYPYLQTYLYSKDISMLENTLLPASLPLDVSILMRQFMATRGLWANACALGIIDTPLYEMIDRVHSRIRQSIHTARSSSRSSN